MARLSEFKKVPALVRFPARTSPADTREHTYMWQALLHYIKGRLRAQWRVEVAQRCTVAQVSRLPMVYEVNIFLTNRHLPIPEVLPGERLLVEQKGACGFYHVIARSAVGCLP